MLADGVVVGVNDKTSEISETRGRINNYERRGLFDNDLKRVLKIHSTDLSAPLALGLIKYVAAIRVT